MNEARLWAPTSLAAAIDSGYACVEGRAVYFDIAQSWCAPGEDRIGYTTITRLVECVRELHWEQQIRQLAPAGVDSMTRSLLADFTRPVRAGLPIRGTYDLLRVGNTSYDLRVILSSVASSSVAATFTLISIFCEPETGKPVPAPKGLRPTLPHNPS